MVISVVSQTDSNRDCSQGNCSAVALRPRRVMTAPPPLALITRQSRTASRNGFVFAKIMIVDCRPPSEKIGLERGETGSWIVRAALERGMGAVVAPCIAPSNQPLEYRDRDSFSAHFIDGLE